MSAAFILLEPAPAQLDLEQVRAAQEQRLADEVARHEEFFLLLEAERIKHRVELEWEI